MTRLIRFLKKQAHFTVDLNLCQTDETAGNSQTFSRNDDWPNKSGHGRYQKIQTGPHQKDRVFEEIDVKIVGRCW